MLILKHTPAKTLIVAATGMELSPVTDVLEHVNDADEFRTRYNYAGNRVDILITGIGSVATACHLTRLLQYEQYDLLINAGIAGSFTRTLKIGDVVNVIEEQFSDMGIEDGERFFTVFEKRLCDKNAFPFVEGVLRNNSEIPSLTFKRLVKVIGSTSNTAHGNPYYIEKLKDKFCLDIETMEGAAFFYAASFSRIPFIQVRAISNYVDTRENNEWNQAPGIANLTDTLIGILDDLNGIR
ncbi:MAG: futalosine hydrolase [Bacteroidetes bacterium]|nr:futalosine hydrolase [Bacteroidota bacterium]